MNWQALSQREQISLILGSTLLVIWGFWSLIYSPMAAQSQALSAELSQAQSIATELRSMQAELSTLPNHAALNSAQAKQHIEQRFQSKIQSLNAQNNNEFVLNLKPMPYKALLQNLLMLKNQHGMVVTQASIVTEDTLVKAQMTVRHP